MIPEHYTNAYWNFVTESCTHYEPFMSEKTFRPIAGRQPFIVAGPRYTLRTLSEMGYKTFGDYIDESYDEIPDAVKRLDAASKVAINLARMSHEDHIAMINELRPRLEHNRKRLIEPKQRIGDFIKYIVEGDPSVNWMRDND